MNRVERTRMRRLQALLMDESQTPEDRLKLGALQASLILLSHEGRRLVGEIKAGHRESMTPDARA